MKVAQLAACCASHFIGRVSVALGHSQIRMIRERGDEIPGAQSIEARNIQTLHNDLTFQADIFSRMMRSADIHEAED